MNLHDRNAPIKEADFMLGRLFATLLFGVVMFVVGYLVAEARMKLDPPCKGVPKNAEYPRTKAEVHAFVKDYHGQDRWWVK